MKAILDGDMLLFAAAASNVVEVVEHDEVICCQADVKDGFINYLQRVDDIAEALHLDANIDIVHCFTEKGMFRRDLNLPTKRTEHSPNQWAFMQSKKGVRQCRGPSCTNKQMI